MRRFGVLFVDDDENILNGIRRLMYGRDEWEVMFAVNGAEALNVMMTHDVHVVVTDIAMPVMDGEQLILRLYDEHPRVVPVVLSGHWSVDISMRQLGPYIQFLPKPVPKEVLLQALEVATSYAALSFS